MWGLEHRFLRVPVPQLRSVAFPASSLRAPQRPRLRKTRKFLAGRWGFTWLTHIRKSLYDSIRFGLLRTKNCGDWVGKKNIKAPTQSPKGIWGPPMPFPAGTSELDRPQRLADIRARMETIVLSRNVGHSVPRDSLLPACREASWGLCITGTPVEHFSRCRCRADASPCQPL